MDDEQLDRINIAELSTQVDAWLRQFQRCPPDLGAVDILCLGGDQTLRRASTFALSSAVAGTEGGLIFSAAYILLGPLHGSATSPDSFSDRTAMCRRNVRDAWTTSSGTQPDQDQERALSARIRIRSVDSYAAEHIPELLKGFEARSAVIIPSAARYSIGPDPSARKFGDPHVRRREWEDVWVARAETIARTALPIAKERDLYLLLDTGEYAPLNPENIARLMTAENGCNFTGARPADDIDAALSRHEQAWTHTEDKTLSRSIAAIDEFESNEQAKAILRAEYLARADRNQEAYLILRPHLPGLCRTGDYRRLLQIAELAQHAGRPWDSANLLRNALDQGLHEETLLHRAMELAWKLDEEDLSGAIQAILSALYPESRITFAALARSTASRQAYDALGAAARLRRERFAEDKTAAYYSMLAQKLNVKTEPSYEQVVEHAGTLDPALLPSAVADVIGDALNRNLTLAAVRVLRSPPARRLSGREHARVLAIA